jgi:phosphoenolpyruvate phosphomutase
MSLKNLITPEKRRGLLKKILDERGFVRVIESHNGLSALIANDTKVKVGEEWKEFDAVWESSLTDTASKGMPDAEIVGLESRCEVINYVLNSTHKPMIVDGDTGRDPNSFEYMVRTLENMGVSAVIIEDKVYPKRNSLEEGAKQVQDNPDDFATKISRGKKVCQTEDFMIIARIESLISGAGMEDAVSRAKKYLKAGADGIMIHSKAKTPDEIIEFSRKYDELCKEFGSRKPLVCVPTTYNTITDSKLKELGFNVVIHANHLLRTAYKAMTEVAEKILLADRSLEVDSLCATTKEIFKHVGFLDIKAKDEKYIPKSPVVIIPAAGKDIEFDVPKAALTIKDKKLLEWQKEALNRIGVTDINVIRGYESQNINIPDINYFENNNYEKSGILSSLFEAKNKMEDGFLYMHSDILFEEYIIKELIETKGDIILVVDNSYTYHKHQIDKRLDLVMSRKKYNKEKFGKAFNINKGEVVRIGKEINKDGADYEFAGIAKFSEKGAGILSKIFQELKAQSKGRFHESDSFEMASFTDIIQELISREVKIEYINIYKGWIEIHDQKDLLTAEELL